MDEFARSNEEKLIEPPAEEPLIASPPEEKLLPAHHGSNGKQLLTKIMLSLVGLVVIVGLILTAYFLISGNTTPPVDDQNEVPVNEAPSLIEGNNTQCTMEAKLCPDGSYVGREAPDCEFAACPPLQDE